MPSPIEGRARRTGGLVGLLLLAGCGGGVHVLVPDTPVKLGRPYAVGGRSYVPVDDASYDQIGEASWYGNAEQGRATANGETFYRQRPSAAHTTLPLPSYVEVTRLDTGQRILVRVNDRGPYARDRILDLSEEAARELGIERAGRSLVRVRRVTPGSSERKRLQRGYPVVLSSVAPSATLPRVGQVAPTMVAAIRKPALLRSRTRIALRGAASARSILIASPSDPDAADALASSLSAEGARVQATGRGYRVIAGPYSDDVSLTAALARLRARGYQGAAVTDEPLPQEPNGTHLP